MDRRVHAECGPAQIVRYDRAGKWYIENVYNGEVYERGKLSVEAAASIAVWFEQHGGVIHYGTRYGSTFDRRVGYIKMGER